MIQNRIGFNYVIMKIMEYEKKEFSLEINSKFNVKEKLSHIYPKYLIGTKLSIFPDIYGNLFMSIIFGIVYYILSVFLLVNDREEDIHYSD